MLFKIKWLLFPKLPLLSLIPFLKLFPGCLFPRQPFFCFDLLIKRSGVFLFQPCCTLSKDCLVLKPKNINRKPNE